MEIMEAIRRRSRSRDSDRAESIPRRQQSPYNPDHPEHEGYDDNHSIADSDLFEMPESYDRIKQDKLGQILINLARDQFLLAQKVNMRQMHSNMDEICDNFNLFLQVNEDQREKCKNEAQVEMEQKMVQQQLNGHLQNQAFPPPAYFSPHPVINHSVMRASEINKLFNCRNNKFSGNPKDNLSLLEFINSMNAGQAQARLSQQEFKDMLLACTTGEAHKFLVDWLENKNEDVASTYHQLAIRFDTRTPPEIARNQLFNYKATKDKTLAQIESDIMSLTYRACDIYPPGESRTMARDFEFCNALMRCLPMKSSELVRREHGDISTLLRRAPTATELSRALHNLRHIIDKDIKMQGLEPNRALKPRFQRGRPNKRPFANHGIYDQRAPSKKREATAFASNVEKSGPPTKGNRRFPRGGQNRERQPNTNPSGRRSVSRNGARRKTGFNGQRRPQGKNNCSLCGQYNHQDPGNCPNMITDNGVQIKLHPIQGTCPNCPGNKKNTLHHPAALCPFRSPHGVFRRTKQ